MKIDIIGSVASGKTTLAKQISKEYSIPYYEKDNVVWMRTNHGDVKRTPEERDKKFAEIIGRDNWIVEGVPRDCLKESYKECDYIILLDESTGVRLNRVLNRWKRQKSGKEEFNSKPTAKYLMYNIKWVYEFNGMRKNLLEELSVFGEKLKVFKTGEEAMKFIESVYTRE